MEIQPAVVDFVIECLDAKFTKGKIVIDGNILVKDVYQTTIKDGIMRKYIYLDEEQGLISRAALIDAQGKEYYVKLPDYQKSNQQGHIISFPMQVKIEGA